MLPPTILCLEIVDLLGAGLYTVIDNEFKLDKAGLRSPVVMMTRKISEMSLEVSDLSQRKSKTKMIFYLTIRKWPNQLILKNQPTLSQNV